MSSRIVAGDVGMGHCQLGPRLVTKRNPGWRHGGLCCDAGAADLCPDVEGSFLPPRDGVALPSACGTRGDCAGHIEKGATYRYRSR